ncbi:MAG: hypothetical protein H7138_22990 [Myxococcales bacterium]|nr:hypothetical protein [Myxococcales bacterium]
MSFRGILLAGFMTFAVLASGASCGDDTQFVLDAPSADAPTLGRVSLAWSITDLTGRPVSCDLVGGRAVSITLRNRGGAGGTPESFSCTSGLGSSRFVESGVYNVSIELRGDTGVIVAVPDQTSVVISGGVLTALDPVVFRVDTQGSFALSIATPPGASNCKSPPQGAGITSMTITLVNQGGSCAAVKLLRSRGSTPLGSYTIDCGSPLTGACIENDETLTPEVPLPSDLYTIRIRGKVGPTECFRNNDELRVPAQGKVLTRTLNLENICTAAQ